MEQLLERIRSLEADLDGLRKIVDRDGLHAPEEMGP
jgi:hypothetical protein